MTNYGTTQRPSQALPTLRPTSLEKDKNTPPNPSSLLHQYFSIPSSPKAAAVRVLRNLILFRYYYTLLIWFILFTSLIPRRRLALLLLVATTAVGCVYLVVLRAMPNSLVLQRVIDPRLVVGLIGMVTVVELVMARAAVHLIASVGIGGGLVLLHGLLRRGEDLYVSEEAAAAAAELVPLVSLDV